MKSLKNGLWYLGLGKRIYYGSRSGVIVLNSPRAEGMSICGLADLIVGCAKSMSIKKLV
jgi:hypothetical protein